MKKLAIMLLALMANCGFAIEAAIDSSTYLHSSENLFHSKVINVYHLTDKDLNEIMQGNQPEIVVEFPAQTTLPISFFLKGDLIENEGNFGQVEVKQTFYIKCVQQELIFSNNLIDWKPFLEFLTGNVSVMLSIQDGKPSIVVDAETNQRF